MKDILAIDLGTSTGYCYNRGDDIHQGAWQLATDKEIAAWGKNRLRRRKDPRIERLCTNLDALGSFDIVVFEDVEFSTYTAQTQLWSSLRSSVWLCAKSTVIECVPVSTLKLFATGKGNATKERMSKYLERKHPQLFSPRMNSDCVDATWLYCFAKHNFCDYVYLHSERA